MKLKNTADNITTQAYRNRINANTDSVKWIALVATVLVLISITHWLL